MENSSVIVTVKNKVQVIQLNRPKKKNAMDRSMYKALTNILNDSANNDDIVVTVLTGSGDFYSSGNDFTSFLEAMSSTEDMFVESKNIIKAFVDAFIYYPKILIAIMNGPAIGIAATTLALCDAVYASEKAYLQTPFVQLGMSPEGCSTYTFPKIFGRSMASEILLFGRKVNMEEAKKSGLVSEVYSSEKVLEQIWDKIYKLTSLPKSSLIQSKRLLKNFDQDTLLIANIREVNELEARWKSEEFLMAISKFSKRSSKL